MKVYVVQRPPQNQAKCLNRSSRQSRMLVRVRRVAVLLLGTYNTRKHGYIELADHYQESDDIHGVYRR